MVHLYRHRVRYRECDPMGVVYHAHYLDYFEAARTEALRSWGVPYRRLEETGVIMPVVDVQLRYHRPGRYDDLLAIETAFPEPPGVRVPIDYTVRRELANGTIEEAPLVTGRVTLCFVDPQRNRPITAPPMIRDAFGQVTSDK
ncbi:MAG: thioesterase family protein [Bacteroidota bacterium]